MKDFKIPSKWKSETPQEGMEKEAKRLRDEETEQLGAFRDLTDTFLKEKPGASIGEFDDWINTKLSNTKGSGVGIIKARRRLQRAKKFSKTKLGPSTKIGV